MKIGFVFLVSTIIVTVVILFSCTKEKVVNNTPCTSCQKVTEAKDYFAFKVGSWWVYEEEASLERDSMYVTESTIDQTGYNFDVQIYSVLQGYYYNYYPLYIENLSGCNEYSPVSKKCLYVNRSKQKPGDYIGTDYCLFFAHKEGDFIYISNTVFPNDQLIIETIFNTYQLGDFVFNRTIKVHEFNTFIEGKQPTNHYFSKGIGLVRKELIDSNKVWNLVSYHIEL